MIKAEEKETLEKIKKIIQNFFDQAPDIEIYESHHWYLTAEWRFILTFTDQGKLFLTLDDDINPLLAAKIAQCLSEAHCQFDMGCNYYYSPFDRAIYYGNQMKNKQAEDRAKQILASDPIKTRQ